MLLAGSSHDPAEIGPGTWLKRLLMYIGLYGHGGCQCDQHAKNMDECGAAVCQARIDEIVGWMKESAEKANLTFVQSQARWLVSLAIKLAAEQRYTNRREKLRLRAMRTVNKRINGQAT